MESFNYRELANLVLPIEKACSKGILKTLEQLVFTDKSMTESVFFKGTSSSYFFDLIIRLYNLQMHGEVLNHFVHVAGPRKLYPFKVECSVTTSTSFAGVGGQLVWSHSTVQVVDPG